MLGILKGHRAEFAERAEEVYNSITIISYQADYQSLFAAVQATVED